MKTLPLLCVFLLAWPLISLGQSLPGAMASIATLHPHFKSHRVSSYDRSGGNGDNISGIKDGETRTILDVKGAGVITHMWFTIAPGPESLSRNDVLLRIYWDGQTAPSVNSPIGPFFGQGWNESYSFTSAPLAASPGGGGRSLISYFPMPFAKGARIEIENQSGKTISALYFNIDYEEVAQLPENTGRFHAWYHREITDAGAEGENEWGTLGKEGRNPTGEKNYVAADIHGTGQFVGLNYYVESPGPIWYGEGDEMVFIDGETKPSINGTGTEDYYNMSWSPRETYMHPYFGLARASTETGWLGRAHAYRFHIADPIYFDKSLRFTIEHGHNNVLTLDLATVAYWYQSEAVAVPPIPNKEGRKLMPPIGPVQIHRWRDAWRREMGSGPKLWGNETKAPAN